jgi:hypothetical protein
MTIKILQLPALVFTLFAGIIINPVSAQKETKPELLSHVKFSLNAYSFNDVLLGKNRIENQPAFTLMELLDWCALQNIEAIDATGYYFPGYPEVPSDEYINNFKQKAFKLGIDISGNFIRFFFYLAFPKVCSAVF